METSANVLLAVLMDAPNAKKDTTTMLTKSNALELHAQMLSDASFAHKKINVMKTHATMITNLSALMLMGSANAMLINGSTKTKHSALTVIR